MPFYHCINRHHILHRYIPFYIFIQFIMLNNTYINTEIFYPLFAEKFWNEAWDANTQYLMNDAAPSQAPSQVVKTGSPIMSSSPSSSTEYSKTRHAINKHSSKHTSSSKKLRPGLCANCGKTEDSTWRRKPNSKEQMCNACGL